MQRNDKESKSIMVDKASTYEQILFHSFAARYRAQKDSWTRESAQRNAARFLLESLPGDRPHHLLDIGTGRGVDLELFLKAGHHATGIDIMNIPDWDALRTTWGQQVTLVCTSFQAFQTNQRYTAALDAGCLHHQDPSEYPAYLQKLHDLLLPGARCVFSVFTPDDESSPGEVFVLDDQRVNRVLSIAEMREYIESAKLRWIEHRRWQREVISGCYLGILVERS